MENQNITLSIPKDVLKKIKHIAIEKNTSVSRLMAKALEDLVHQEEGYQMAKERQLVLMEKGIDFGSCMEAGRNREELHER